MRITRNNESQMGRDDEDWTNVVAARHDGTQADQQAFAAADIERFDQLVSLLEDALSARADLEAKGCDGRTI